MPHRFEGTARAAISEGERGCMEFRRRPIRGAIERSGIERRLRMSGYTSSMAKERRRVEVMRGAIFFAGLFSAAAFIGALVGLEPLLSAKLSVPLLLLLFLVIACNLPKVKEPSVRKLRYTLTALAAMSIFWPTYALFSYAGLPAIDPKKIILAILLLAFVYSILTAPAVSSRVRERVRLAGWPAKLLLLFMLWRLLSAVSSTTPVASLIQYGWEAATFYLVFFATLASVKDVGDVREMAMVLTLSALIVGCLAILERFVGHNLFLGIIPATPEYIASQLASLDIRVREGQMRVQATFEHPMALAEFLVFVLPIAASLATRTFARSRRILALGSVLLIVVGISFSATRSAILAIGGLTALSVSLYFMQLVRDGRMGLKSYLSVLGLIIVGMVALASLGVAEKLIQGRSAEERGSSLERVEQLQRGFPKIQAAPMLGAGVGLGNDQIGFSALRGRLYVDNYYLTLALDSGVPAMVLFLLSIIGFAWIGVQLYLSRQGELALFAGALGLSLAGVAVMKLVLSIHYNLLFAYLAFGMLVVLKEQAGDAKRLGRPGE
jgi:hypothetical protein